MDFTAVITRLHECANLMTIQETASIFDVHATTINRWVRQLGFPKTVKLERMRLFRPDQVLKWTEQQFEDCRGMLTLEEVCERVGIFWKTWVRWVKNGRAPQPRRRELGSGKHLWDACDIENWLQEKTGGYARRKQPPKTEKQSTSPSGSRRGPKHHDKFVASAA